MLRRIATLIIKELRMIMRNRQSRVIVIVPVLMQIAIFPFAATLEVKNATIAIYDNDGGKHALELAQRLAQGSSFSQLLLLHSESELASAIERQKALLAMHFPANFSRNILEGHSAPVQVILDGRRSNAGQIAMNYVQNILVEYQTELLLAGQSLGQSNIPLNTRLEFRNWYNPNLDYVWFVLPSLVALITTIGVMIFTALSVAREREQGTMDQLLVSPLSTGQIFIGKAVPSLIIATLQGTMVLLAGVFFYRIPFSGSLALFYLNIFIYGLSLVGIGLLISALCNTQQQALIGVLLFMMPAILLSGYITPVENMPMWLQQLTLINPVRHFTEITKQIYLKDASLAVLWQSMWPMLVITFVSVAVAYLFFRRKIN